MTKEEAIKKVKACLTDYFPQEEYDKVEEIIEALQSSNHAEPYKVEKKPTCGNCKKWGTVNCAELYREPMENDDACISFNSESEV